MGLQITARGSNWSVAYSFRASEIRMVFTLLNGYNLNRYKHNIFDLYIIGISINANVIYTQYHICTGCVCPLPFGLHYFSIHTFQPQQP